MQPAIRRRIPVTRRGRQRRMSVAGVLLAGAVGLSGCSAASDVWGVDPSPTDTNATTSAPATVAEASPDPATLIIDRLFEAFNAQDAEEVSDVFGDEVVYVLHDDDEELVGVEAATYWQGYFGSETGTRITDAFHGPDGRTYFLGTFEFSNGASQTFVFDVEMDDDRLVRMGDRNREFGEVVAASEVDDIYQAFNDQDIARLRGELDGVTYTSASGVEYTGAEAADHFAAAFGLVATRTSGVFVVDDGTFWFVVEYVESDSGRTTSYTVEVERSAGQIVSITERPSET